MFSDCYYPTINGVSTSIKVLAQSLLDNGHQVLLVVPDHPNAVPESDAFFRSGVRVLRVPSKPCKYHADNRVVSPGVFYKWDVLREFAPEIIHIHTPFEMGKWGIKWGKRFKIPCVFTYHTMLEQYTHYVKMPKFIAVIYARILTKSFCKKCQAVIAPSRYVANYLTSKLRVRRPVSVIPTGVPSDIFTGGDMCEAAKYVPKVGATHLLYVGRLAKEKNLDFIWQAFASLRPRYPALRLLIVGDGPYREYLQNLTKLMRLEDSIIFVGWQPRERLRHFYALARCLVFASQTETQGLVLTEAQAAGVPVVAVRAGGVEESVRDGASGYLVNPGDISAFVERITRVIENGEVFVSMSRAARAWASQLSDTQMAAQVYNCYREVLNK
ncbi:glycosyltransferase [bacterium]|nr:glycosyltransferase [bacterium]